MASYILSDSAGRYDIETYNRPFTVADAFDLVDFLDTKGYLDADTAEVLAKPYWEPVTDPRP